MLHLYIILVTLVIQIAQTTNETITSELLALGLAPETQIAPASNYTQRWSTYNAPSYVTAVKPATDDDVAKIIKYATKFSIPFLSTGGGHGFATSLGGLRNGIELDLSHFDGVNVDVKSNTLTIGGAVRTRDILEPLAQAHKELSLSSPLVEKIIEVTDGSEAIPSVSCVGMVGATLGGGVGRYSGLHGVLLDSLSSVRMVTAAGEIVTASISDNADLFWGIRGAGFNYGTILEATYTIYDETAPQVLNADFLFAPNASRTILEYFKTFEGGLPAKLSLILLAAYSSELGGSFLIVNAVYAGPQAEGEKYLYPLLNASSIRSNLTMVPWSSLNAISFFGNEPTDNTCPSDSPHNVYGGAVHQFDIDTFQSFYENYETLTASMPEELNGTVYFIEFFAKQAVEAVPANATAYPWRNITAHLLFNFAYNDTKGVLDQRVNDLARAARRNFTSASGFAQPELYLSYGHGDEDLETLYSAKNLPRLLSLKAKWDPHNVYRYNYPLVQ